MLTQERLKEVISYEPNLGIFTWITRRQRVKVGGVAGSVVTNRNGKKYVSICIDGSKYLAHRLATLHVTGSFPPNQTDHEDGNGLNNKWANLRNVTHKENSKNRRLQDNNKSGFSGVYWHKSAGKWMADITVNKKTIYLGLFIDRDSAITARQAANLKYTFHENHGQARTL